MPQYDQFDVALAGVPSDEERQRQVADRLRGQTGLGAYIQTLGDPMTAQAGQNIQKVAADQTSALQKTREHQAKLAAEKLDAEQDRALERELDALEIPKSQMPTMGEQREDVKMMKEYQETTDLIDSFEDAYATMQTSEFKAAQAVGDMPIPGSRAFSNWLVNKVGVDKETAARSNQWWKRMNAMYNFPERYKLFGATLTGNEKQSWDKVAAGESMDPKVVRMLMADVKARITADVRRGANVRRGADFKESYIESVFGNMGVKMTPEQIKEEANMGRVATYADLGYDAEGNLIQEDVEVVAGAPAAAAPGAPGGALPQPDIPVWDPSKQQRLDELRKKHPR